MSARDIYESVVRQLPAYDRLRLASMILADLTSTDGGGLDMHEDWNEDDNDLSAFALTSAEPISPPEEHHAA